MTDHPLTWTTTHGDVVEMYSKVKTDPRGEKFTGWKWRRLSPDRSQLLAQSGRATSQTRAVAQARRVNVPHPWIPFDVTTTATPPAPTAGSTP